MLGMRWQGVDRMSVLHRGYDVTCDQCGRDLHTASRTGYGARDFAKRLYGWTVRDINETGSDLCPRCQAGEDEQR
jgi:hypothetical protein